MMKEILNEWRKYLIKEETEEERVAWLKAHGGTAEDVARKEIEAEKAAATSAGKKSPRFRQDVLDMQVALNKLMDAKGMGKLPKTKYSPVGEDGDYGPQTRSYVLKFISEPELKKLKIVDITKKLQSLNTGDASGKPTPVEVATKQDQKYQDLGRGVDDFGRKTDDKMYGQGKRIDAMKPLEIGLTIDKPFESAAQYAQYIQDMSYRLGKAKELANKTFYVRSDKGWGEVRIIEYKIGPNPENDPAIQRGGVSGTARIVKKFMNTAGEVPAGNPGSKDKPFENLEQAEEYLKNNKQKYPDQYKPGARFWYKAKSDTGKFQSILYSEIQP